MDSVDNDIKILRKILSKSKKEYNKMKKECVKMKTFSYQKYVSVMLKFLK